MSVRGWLGGKIRRLVGWPLLAVMGLVVFFTGLCVGFPCFSTGVSYGLWLDQCPVGMRLEADVRALRLARGGIGELSIRPMAVWVDDDGYQGRSAFGRGVSISTSLLDEDDHPLDGVVLRELKRSGVSWYGDLELPDLPDGDYTLRTEISTSFDTMVVDAPVALYSSSLGHVLVERPLVRPGDEVGVRAVSLRATDRTPIAKRAGTWQLIDPAGEIIWQERAKTNTWGVTHTSFPIDSGAQMGPWKARWVSGDDVAESTFRVERFTLPPATVTVTPHKPWYTLGDAVRIEGAVRTNAGVPLRNVPVNVTLSTASGRWPVPLAWESIDGVKTDRQGRFEIDLGQVPADLIERAEVAAVARVVTPSGETVVGRGRVVLSVHGLAIEAVTELSDGLVKGVNNRAYLRVTTPDGAVLPETAVTVANPWDPDATVSEGVTDEDGVVAVQLDPGDPITVVIPPAPVRQRPFVPRQPELVGVNDLETGRAADGGTRRAVARTVSAVHECSYLVASGSQTANVSLQVAAGRIRARTAASPLAACVADAMDAVRWPSASTRTLSVQWTLYDPQWSRLVARVGTEGATAPGLDAAVAAAQLSGRACLEGVGTERGSRIGTWHWGIEEGKTRISRTFVGPSSRASLRRCLERVWRGVALEHPANADQLGTVQWTLQPPPGRGGAAPTALTREGYELLVTHTDSGASGRLELSPGSVPALRIRVEPALAAPGEEVTATLYRGPDYLGDLPETLSLQRGGLSVARAKLDEDTRSAKLAIPEDARGILHVSYLGARGLVFVEDPDRLSVTLGSDKPAYRPGETSEVWVATRRGDLGVPASVGLVGVDTALGQLAPLPGPDDLGRAVIRAKSDRPAFGVFGPAALELGLIRGDQAARAALLRISHLPDDAAGTDFAAAQGQGSFDERLAMSDAFYGVLDVLYEEVAAWEASAPESERMTPARMVKTWERALEVAASRDVAVEDGFGRRLTLDVLPADLLEEVSPQRVVSSGTRLPEDVVNWASYVREEVP